MITINEKKANKLIYNTKNQIRHIQMKIDDLQDQLDYYTQTLEMWERLKEKTNTDPDIRILQSLK